MTERPTPHAGPETNGAGAPAPRPTPQQARFAAQRLREHARTARTLAVGGRALGAPAWEAEEHDRSAAAYDACAAVLEGMAGP